MDVNEPHKPQRYDFNQQKQLGIHGEAILDAFFSRWYLIQEVPPELQREGVDRFFVPRRGEVNFPRLVEYKTDFKDTGNVFIETHSVIRAGQKDIKGWLYTSKADWLIYFLVEYQTVLVLSFPTLRDSVFVWESKQLCRCKSSQNNDYQGAGLIVPIPLMLRESHAIFKLQYKVNSSL
jgi:hypothetical protein